MINTDVDLSVMKHQVNQWYIKSQISSHYLTLSKNCNFPNLTKSGSFTKRILKRRPFTLTPKTKLTPAGQNFKHYIFCCPWSKHKFITGAKRCISEIRILAMDPSTFPSRRIAMKGFWGVIYPDQKPGLVGVLCLGKSIPCTNS